MFPGIVDAAVPGFSLADNITGSNRVSSYKNAAAKLVTLTDGKVTFGSQFHDIEFTDAGDGMYIGTPEWDGMDLYLTKAQVMELKALIDVVVSRP